MKKYVYSICFFLFVGICQLQAQTTLLTVNADKPIAPIQPTMWGIFFEDINLGADGGVYAELVKNRSFEFTDKPLMGWKELVKDATNGRVVVQNQVVKFPNNPRYALVYVNATKGQYGLQNDGFRGMGFKKGMQYDLSLLTQAIDGDVKLHVELINPNGDVLGSTTLAASSKDWQKQTASLTSTATEPMGKLRIWFEGKGVLAIDMVSLFPRDTWKNRPNGLRADLVQLLADMKPGFLRFPGGCIVEGSDLTKRYQWKKTLGKLEDRKTLINRWNYEFAHRPTPDYFQTFGLGFFEYFQLAEDIGAEPLPILNCGMACQFNSSEVVPISEIDEYIQDMLDLVEFANGATSTPWGKVRADLGHPAPFNLKFMGVGNEQWGPQYIERLELFTKAMKSKYPEIRLITGAGPDPNGDKFDYLNGVLRQMNVDIIDEHYYRPTTWFLQNANRYDTYDRKGPKIFAGEYAAQSVATVSPDNKNNWNCAMSEAAFMTGLERNAEVVHLASYAPLFAHVQGWQWTPDLIWFDNLKSYGTPNYYVQKLYGTNKGTHVVSITEQGAVVSGQKELYASSALDKSTQELIVKLVNTSAKAQAVTIQLDGTKKVAKTAKLVQMKNDNLDAVNSIESPQAVSPTEQNIPLKGNQLPIQLPARSFSVIRIKVSPKTIDFSKI